MARPVIEPAYDKYPDHRIDISPSPGTGRVWHGDLLLAESTRCLLLTESKHVDRLYFHRDDVRWEHFTATDFHTICPFKGEADYWSLTAPGHTFDGSANIVWAYPEPFQQVGQIAEYVCFYEDRLRVEIDERWTEIDRSLGTTCRFPLWGDASDLLRLIDVAPSDRPNHFVGPPYATPRNVVEGGQLLGASIVAASKAVPGQRVTSAYMVFSKAASFDDPLDFVVDVVKPGRTFSTVEVRVNQLDSLRSIGLMLLDAGATDVMRGQAEMPDVPGPDRAIPYDFRVSGRDLRIVDGAYTDDPDSVGPPVIYSWVRFRKAPAEQYLHTALMAQSTTHWTIAAGMRPHKGISERLAHVTLSTGVMTNALSIHEDVDVSQWLLYANPAIYSGRGLVQGEGKIFTQDGRLVASYTPQAMVRDFVKPPSAMGMDHTNAM